VWHRKSRQGSASAHPAGRVLTPADSLTSPAGALRSSCSSALPTSDSPPSAHPPPQVSTAPAMSPIPPPGRPQRQTPATYQVVERVGVVGVRCDSPLIKLLRFIEALDGLQEVGVLPHTPTTPIPPCVRAAACVFQRGGLLGLERTKRSGPLGAASMGITYDVCHSAGSLLQPHGLHTHHRQ
jgi:hypothetical protein